MYPFLHSALFILSFSIFVMHKKCKEVSMRINKFTAGLMLMIFLLTVPIVSAEYGFDDELSDDDKATFDKILEPVMKIYTFVKYIATFIAALVLLFAGIGYMSSGSDPKKRDNSKAMAMYVFIGLAIIWAAPIIVQFIVG